MNIETKCKITVKKPRPLQIENTLIDADADDESRLEKNVILFHSASKRCKRSSDRTAAIISWDVGIPTSKC
jgi:hypothetical protein